MNNFYRQFLLSLHFMGFYVFINFFSYFSECVGFIIQSLWWEFVLQQLFLLFNLQLQSRAFGSVVERVVRILEVVGSIPTMSTFCLWRKNRHRSYLSDLALSAIRLQYTLIYGNNLKHKNFITYNFCNE